MSVMEKRLGTTYPFQMEKLFPLGRREYRLAPILEISVKN